MSATAFRRASSAREAQRLAFTGEDPAERRTVPAEDAMRIARAAARLALQGKAWDPEDRADCASDILLRAYGKVPEGSRGGDLPPDLGSFTYLHGLAANWRRATEAQRQRDAADAAGKSTIVTFPMGEQSATGEDPSPETARAVAADMLAAWGLPRLGRAWPLAYCAAREAQGFTRAEALAEVGIEFPLTSAGKMRLARARDAVPSAARFTVEAHALLLGNDHAADTRPRDVVKLDDGWRDRADRKLANVVGSARDESPVTCRKAKRTERKRAADRRKLADWTKDLGSTNASRLAAAAQLRRKRATSRDEGERRTMRLASGIPATVR